MTGPVASIMIVEDEWFIAAECEAILADHGYNVVGVATDESEALSLAKDAVPDLAIMDIKLARNGDGVEVAKKLRRAWNIASIFVTSYNDEITRRRAADAQPVGWLIKPYLPQDLLKTVQEGLGAP